MSARHHGSTPRLAFSPPRTPLWLPGVFPFFRLAALAAGVYVCFPFPLFRRSKTHECLFT
jgi:hypothetical protein